MQITVNIEKLRTGRYSVVVNTDDGPMVGDGMLVEGVIRLVSLAIVDSLAECVNVADLERWGSDE